MDSLSTLFEKARKKGGGQGSLEYIILIGGVLIIAAAAYFMLKGFQQTSTGNTVGSIGSIGSSHRTETLNMARSQHTPADPDWDVPSLQNRYTIQFTKTGSSGNISFGLNKTNLTDESIVVASVVAGWKGSWNVLELIPDADWLNYTTPYVALGDTFTVYIYYNNTSGYGTSIDVDSSDTVSFVSEYSLWELDPPYITIGDPAEFNLGDIISFDVDVDANPGFTISNVKYRLYSGSGTGNGSVLLCSWINADNFAYSLDISSQTIILEGLTNGYGNTEHEDLTINIRYLETTGDYTLEVEVTDGALMTNSTSKTIEITESGGGTYTT